jgi:uncharacterized lipoprotein NlpE involved in copper resistance
MKRVVLLIVALFSVFSALGCMNKNEMPISQVEKITFKFKRFCCI